MEWVRPERKGMEAGIEMSSPLLWFVFDDLETDLESCIAAFEEKFGRSATVLWTRDGRAGPEGFALAAKADQRLGRDELYLE